MKDTSNYSNCSRCPQFKRLKAEAISLTSIIQPAPGAHPFHRHGSRVIDLPDQMVVGRSHRQMRTEPSAVIPSFSSSCFKRLFAVGYPWIVQDTAAFKFIFILAVFWDGIICYFERCHKLAIISRHGYLHD